MADITVPLTIKTISHPLILPLPTLPPTTAFPLDVSVTAVSADQGGILMLSPLELIVDQPFHLGCFRLVLTVFFATQLASPHQCLLHCSRNGMRFAAIQQGGECSCLPATSLAQLPALEAGECSIRCADEDNFFCGGEIGASFYVAGGANIM